MTDRDSQICFIDSMIMFEIDIILSLIFCVSAADTSQLVSITDL